MRHQQPPVPDVAKGSCNVAKAERKVSCFECEDFFRNLIYFF